MVTTSEYPGFLNPGGHKKRPGTFFFDLGIAVGYFRRGCGLYLESNGERELGCNQPDPAPHNGTEF